MSETLDILQLQKLVELCNPKQDEIQSDDDSNIQNTKERSSTSTKENQSSKKKLNPYSKIDNTNDKFSRDLFEFDEDGNFSLKDNDKHKSDWKKTPKYDITYKQQVTASDVFLQMGMKTPATASCEDMIVTVHMPGESRHNMDLKVLEDKLELVSPRFYLNLPLPQPVDPKRGNAQWDQDAENLIITLRMERELDLVNF